MFKRTLTALAMLSAVFGGIVLVPSTAMAQVGVDLKFYDRSHKDYHVWNDGEDKSYRAYLETRHRTYREFSKTSKAQQQAYWKWRHDHP
jgi:hypothetical protein